MSLEIFNHSNHKIISNPLVQGGETYPSELDRVLGKNHCESAIKEIKAWPGYSQTPLYSLEKLKEKLKLGSIFYKDESSRFGLGSFKSLGGTYALLCVLQKELSKKLGFPISTESIRKGEYKKECQEITVVTATDGNHGRSVAWGAKLFHCKCKIYMHEEVSLGRQKIVEDLGAKVVRTLGNYDDSVKVANKEAKENGWFVVSDTSTEDYQEIPGLVMSGYSVLLDEALEQMENKTPTHVFLQAGVGGLAGALCARFWQLSKESLPHFVVVEPELADCLYQSAFHQRPTLVDIKEESMMAGLSCGKISYLAWEILSRKARSFMKIPENYVPECMRSLAYGEYGSEKIEAGESAVAGLAALIEGALDETKRRELGLNEESRVLLIGTEGATDPEIYKKIVN